MRSQSGLYLSITVAFCVALLWLASVLAAFETGYHAADIKVTDRCVTTLQQLGESDRKQMADLQKETKP